MAYFPQIYKAISTAGVNIDTSYVTLGQTIIPANKRAILKLTFTAVNSRYISTLANEISYRIRSNTSGVLALGKGSISSLGDEASYNSCMLTITTSSLSSSDTIYFDCACDVTGVITASVQGVSEIISTFIISN